MITATDFEDRPPVDHLVCTGNVVGWIADLIVNRIAIGRSDVEAGHWWPVSVEYDAETNTSRVGVSYLPPVREPVAA